MRACLVMPVPLPGGDITLWVTHTDGARPVEQMGMAAPGWFLLCLTACYHTLQLLVALSPGVKVQHCAIKYKLFVAMID